MFYVFSCLQKFRLCALDQPPPPLTANPEVYRETGHYCILQYSSTSTGLQVEWVIADPEKNPEIVNKEGNKKHEYSD